MTMNKIVPKKGEGASVWTRVRTDSDGESDGRAQPVVNETVIVDSGTGNMTTIRTMVTVVTTSS